MTFINASVSSSMTALRLLTAGGVAPVQASVPSREAVSAPSPTLGSGDVQSLLDYAAAAKLAGEDSALAQVMRATGAATARLEVRPELSDDDFRSLVMENLMANHGDEPGFQMALRDGTLSIQRFEEVPELRLGRLLEYDLYDRDGNMLGGGASSLRPENVNQALYDERTRAGLAQTVGVQMGYDFYASWPAQP